MLENNTSDMTNNEPVTESMSTPEGTENDKQPDIHANTTAEKKETTIIGGPITRAAAKKLKDLNGRDENPHV